MVHLKNSKMKRIIIILITICVVSCQSNKTNISSDIDMNSCDSVLSGLKIEDTTLCVYKVKNSFIKYLDTIIKYEKSCRFYYECRTGFMIYLYNKTQFVIERIPSIYYYDYSRCKGIFIYNNIKFFLYDSIPILAEKTNEYIHVKYEKKTENNKYFPEYSDAFSEWTFEYDSKKFILVGKFECVK